MLFVMTIHSRQFCGRFSPVSVNNGIENIVADDVCVPMKIGQLLLRYRPSTLKHGMSENNFLFQFRKITNQQHKTFLNDICEECIRYEWSCSCFWHQSPGAMQCPTSKWWHFTLFSDLFSCYLHFYNTHIADFMYVISAKCALSNLV